MTSCPTCVEGEGRWTESIMESPSPFMRCSTDHEDAVSDNPPLPLFLAGREKLGQAYETRYGKGPFETHNLYLGSTAEGKQQRLVGVFKVLRGSRRW
jgi:hypothetical protein